MGGSDEEGERVTEEPDAEQGPIRRILPTRAGVLGRVGKVLWPVRSAKAQKVAGEESARHAVRVAEPEAEPDTGAEAPGPEPGAVITPAPTDDEPLTEPAEAEAEAVESEVEAVEAEAEAEATQFRLLPEDVDPGAVDASEAEFTDLPPGFVAETDAAAFFDVDNTLIQGASLIHFGRGLAKHKFFTSNDLLDMAWTQLKFQVSGKENADDVASGREKALGFVKGRTVTELTALGEEIFDESMVERIWPGTRALTQMHMDAGQQVWLVTATPLELARVIAERLGLTGALGTVAESVDGVYTGRLVGDILHGPGKAHAIESLVEREGFDLEKCYAYSDSHNDVPMLSMVGHAIAINPDSALRSLAKEKGWEVKDFRTVRKVARRTVPVALAGGAVGSVFMAARSELGARFMRDVRKRF